jgi:hypothetical protein
MVRQVLGMDDGCLNRNIASGNQTKNILLYTLRIAANNWIPDIVVVDGRHELAGMCCRRSVFYHYQIRHEIFTPPAKCGALGRYYPWVFREECLESIYIP